MIIYKGNAYILISKQKWEFNVEIILQCIIDYMYACL